MHPCSRCWEDKWSFYLFCKKHGLTVPLTVFVNDKPELQFGSIALGVLFAIKAPDQVASYGVEVITDEANLGKKVIDNQGYRYAPLIVQRFIAGTDIGLNLS